MAAPLENRATQVSSCQRMGLVGEHRIRSWEQEPASMEPGAWSREHGAECTAAAKCSDSSAHVPLGTFGPSPYETGQKRFGQDPIEMVGLLCFCVPGLSLGQLDTGHRMELHRSTTPPFYHFTCNLFLVACLCCE